MFHDSTNQAQYTYKCNRNWLVLIPGEAAYFFQPFASGEICSSRPSVSPPYQSWNPSARTSSTSRIQIDQTHKDKRKVSFRETSFRERVADSREEKRSRKRTQLSIFNNRMLIAREATTITWMQKLKTVQMSTFLPVSSCGINSISSTTVFPSLFLMEGSPPCSNSIFTTGRRKALIEELINCFNNYDSNLLPYHNEISIIWFETSSHSRETSIEYIDIPRTRRASAYRTA